MKTRNNKFTTKDEYLAYRAEWKADYKRLSVDIRNAKLSSKDGARNPLTYKRDEKGVGSWVHSKPVTEQEAARSDAWKVAKEHWGSWCLSPIATAMLEELKQAKLEAQQQYLKQKGLVA
jgi:hypothetical protein